ncbi:unnamed protein product [Withania somnifera]
MVESAVNILIISIEFLLHNPGYVIGGVRHESWKVKLELESIGSFIKDADKLQVRDVVFKAEDIIDEFSYCDSLKRSGFSGQCWMRIRAEIKDIRKQSKRYNLSHMVAASVVGSNSKSSLFIQNDEVLGIDQVKESILSRLEVKETHYIVISVPGMGGSGETTLVVKAYTSLTVRKNFDCCACVSVSQNNTTEDLLKTLISEFFNGEEDLIPKNLKSMEYRQLVGTLVKFLHKKRYVLVFDDVWNNYFWRHISVAIPDDKNMSRIIITTRNEDIAAFPYGPGGTHVFSSKPLADAYTWRLFQPNCQCPSELEKIGRALVKKCEGLPLAIVALGGLMGSIDRSELKWREVYESLSWHISNSNLLDEVKTVMLMGFNDFPYYLKNCFLYCCRFLMGEWIRAGKLIRMWMAEGFLEENSSLNPEKVGKIYLKELISRNLLLVQKRQSFIRPKLCKLHDLMWELACSRISYEMKARRLSVLNVDGTLKMSGGSTHVESFSMFRLLRVLELDDAKADSLPNELRKLFNVRYLSMNGTGIKELPTSVNQLRNLQKLVIRRTEVNLSAHHFAYVRGVQVSGKLWKLKNLQVLNCIEVNADIARKIRKLTKLRRIELTNVKEEYMKNLCSSIDKLKFLHHLLDMTGSPFRFRKVTLVGKLTRTPCWFSSMLKIIHLHRSHQLPSLEHLVLVNAYTNKKQLFFESGFQKLEDLHVPEGLQYFTNLEQMNLKSISSELVENIRGEGSTGRSKVRRIPSIKHYYEVDSIHMYVSLS